MPEDLHDMLEEGVELMHGRAMTAVLGNGKVESLQLHPARFSGAINASPINIDREAPPQNFAVDHVIIAVGQRASLAWLPAEFKNERGTIKIDSSDVSATRTSLPQAISFNSVRVSR